METKEARVNGKSQISPISDFLELARAPIGEDSTDEPVWERDIEVFWYVYANVALACSPL